MLKTLTWASWLKPSQNIPDSKSHRLKETSSMFCRDPSLSVDRQNSFTDPCLQAGIMPVPIEIFDSDPGPVWSSMPSHCARIFSGLQVSGHDTAVGRRTQIKWLITHNLIELSALALSLSFWQTWQCCVSFSPFYVPTIDSPCCNSPRNIIKTGLIPASSIICSLWKHDLEPCCSSVVIMSVFCEQPLRNKWSWWIKTSLPCFS